MNNKVPNEVVALINASLQLNLYKSTDLSYGNLFDSLMYKYENSKVLFDYIFEQFKTNMFDKRPIAYQKKEMKRLFDLNILFGEFDRSIKQELKSYN